MSLLPLLVTKSIWKTRGSCFLRINIWLLIRQVTTLEGESKAKEHEILFTETSAKADQNVQNLFRTLAMNLTGGEQSTINRGHPKPKEEESRNTV